MRYVVASGVALLCLGCSSFTSPWDRDAVVRELSNDREAATRMCGVPTPGLEQVQFEPQPGRELGTIHIKVTGLPREVAEPRPRCEAIIEIMLWPQLHRSDGSWGLSYRPLYVYVSEVYTPGVNLRGGHGGHHLHH